MVYNPLDQPVNRTLTIPLYYTGLTHSAKVSERDAAPNFFALDREYRIALPVTVAPKSQTWFVIEEDSLILAPDRTAPSQRER